MLLRKNSIPDLFGNYLIEPIHYLTWHQPFASLMLHGKKETRRKPTNVRGTVLILASDSPYPKSELIKLCGSRLLKIINETTEREPTKNITGKAIAIGRLTGCRPMQKKDASACFVKYVYDKFVWHFEEVKRIEPFEMKGKQGWGILRDQDILNQIKIID